MIDSNKIKKIQNEIKLAISLIEKNNKVKISFGGCRYTSTEYGVRMTVKTVEKTESVKNSYEEKNLMLSKRYGFKQNIIGLTFYVKKSKYKICEIKPRNRKYPIIATDQQGKSYKFTSYMVSKCIGGDTGVKRQSNLIKLL